MQATESYIGSDQRLDVRLLEKETWELQDALSRHLPSFYRRAYRYLGNAADAEDAVQDALLSACRHLDQFKGQAKMSTWLTTIVINSALTKLRRRPRQIHTSLDERLGEDQKYCVSERLADCRPSPEDECVGSDLHGRFMQFVAKLSPSLRKAYQLRDLDGLTTSEAAQILGVADVTLKAQVSRARAELRRLMRLALDAQPRSKSGVHRVARYRKKGSNGHQALTRRTRHDIAMEHRLPGPQDVMQGRARSCCSMVASSNPEDKRDTNCEPPDVGN